MQVKTETAAQFSVRGGAWAEAARAHVGVHYSLSATSQSELSWMHK